MWARQINELEMYLLSSGDTNSVLKQDTGDEEHHLLTMQESKLDVNFDSHSFFAKNCGGRS